MAFCTERCIFAANGVSAIRDNIGCAADHRDVAAVEQVLDSLGPALLSLTGHDDRLRMHCLVA